MKDILKKTIFVHFLIGLLIILISNKAQAQCNNYNSNYPTGTSSTTSTTLVTVSTCMYGGEYTYFNVTAGNTYTWTTCGDSDFDTQLTLTQGSNTTGADLAYNDDACGTQSTITWSATFTGTVTLLLSKHNCSNYSTCMTVQWKSNPPSCNDGIKNQGETGVDCGGPCAACPPPTVQDCEGAIPICQNSYSEATAFSGQGNYPTEINSGTLMFRFWRKE